MIQYFVSLLFFHWSAISRLLHLFAHSPWKPPENIHFLTHFNLPFYFNVESAQFGYKIHDGYGNHNYQEETGKWPPANHILHSTWPLKVRWKQSNKQQQQHH